MKILITGDLVINREYNISNLHRSVISLFKQSDLNIVNLEAPVTNSKYPIDKTGPNIKSFENSTKDVLNALNVDLVTLANNHILDYGEQGVVDTLDFCEINDIKTVGAGKNLDEASKTLFINTDVGRIAFVNFAENEWTSASENSAGSNPIDFIDNTKQISGARKNADFVIVIIHGGNEYNHYPNPRMVKQYRYYADCGADIIIGHHTHCISGYEVYNDVPILYSLGNFLFTMNSSKEVWYTGLIASLNIEKDKKISFELIPIEQSRIQHELFLPDKPKLESISSKIKEINYAILNPEQLELHWQEFVYSVQPGFIKSITPMAGFNNKYIKVLLYRLGIYKWFFNKKYLKESLNRIRCEAHYDVTKEIFKNLLK